MAAAPGTNLPVFSYAQAAKGRATSTSASQPQTEPSVNSAKPSLSEKKSLTLELDVPNQSHDSGPATVKPEHTKDLLESESRGEIDQHLKNSSSAENHNSPPDQPSAVGSETQLPPEKVSAVGSEAKGKSSPNTTDSTPVSAQDEAHPTVPNGLAESWDKQSETSTVVDKAIQTSENGNETSAENDWALASDSKSEQEFKAAPIPTVNIWQQRKEAQDAKLKASAGSRSSTIINAPVRSKPHAQTFRGQEADTSEAAVKRRPSGRAGEKGDSSLKKKTDETRVRDDLKRGSRQNRATEADKEPTESSTAPPPVGDAALWPTPETATHEDKKKPYALDKAEKTDGKSPGVKPNQKWVAVPYTPTPKFTTPLPPTLSRRGGRPTRGSREGGRGGHISQGSVGDRPDKTKNPSAAPMPKQTTEQQRGRNQESAAGDRATSAPTQTRRAVSVGPSFDGTRRPAPATLSGNRKQPGGEAPALPLESPSNGNQDGISSFRTRADSKSFSRQSSNSYRGASYDNSRQVGAESHSHPRHFSGAERRNTYGESDKNGEAAARRDWQEFSNSGGKSRDADPKSESWRDRDLTGERSEPRNGRGRGGFRGRGGNNHANYGVNPATPTHAFTAPLPQQPFASGKPHGYGDRHRQQSVPFSGLPPQGSHRGNPRSQSMATHGIFPGMQNNFGPSIAPINTEFQGMYSGYSPIYPGIMTAVPYSNAIEPNALISMVTAQLDYYFSIENLCKDMYLRSNMDSRGWVPLSVIAGFNRIKSLTEDMNLIRYVCQLSRNIEFRPGDDGNDRIRKLEKWEHWILDMDQRQAHAQNDGPPPLPRNQSPPHISQGFPTMPHVASPTWSQAPYYDTYAEVPAFTPRNFPPEDQGIASPTQNHLPEIPSGEGFSLTNGQLEATTQSAGHVPEVEAPANGPQPAFASPPSRLSPSSARSSTPALNGTGPASHQEIGAENVFSNDRVNELHICVRHAPQQQQPSFLSPGNRSFSHGSIDGTNLGATNLNASLTPLRGGSGSPERPSPSHNRSVSGESSSSGTDRGVFWMKDGAPPDSWNQGGSTVERYQSLYDRAMSERIPGDVSNDLDWLYQFWSHFLVRNFNHDMYNDFRSLAIEDGTAGDDKGLSHLSQYYGALLSGSQVLSGKLADDITKIAGAEYDTKRHVFQRLRSAWRNGAFNFKSRKLIDKSLSADLKAELEK